jgi:hypothetical protein
MPDRVRNGRRRATTAKRLLADSVIGLDPAILARVAGVPVEELVRWSTTSHRMTLAERAALAIAVIAIAPESSPLFRDALNLRAQVQAAFEYETHVTSRGENPKPSRSECAQPAPRCAL